MVVVAEGKGLVYSDEQVTFALAILRSSTLATNAAHGIWSATVNGYAHLKISEDEVREMIKVWNVRRNAPSQEQG